MWNTAKNKKAAADSILEIKDQGIRRNLNGFAALCASWDLPQDTQYPKAPHQEIVQWPATMMTNNQALNELRLIAIDGSYPMRFLSLIDEFLEAVPAKHRKQPACADLKKASAQARTAYNFCLAHDLIIPMLRFAGGLAQSSVGLRDSPHFPAMVYHDVGKARSLALVT
jgi:hypothetical protein